MPDNKGGGEGDGGGMGSDNDTTAEEVRPVRLAVISYDSGTGADDYHYCGGQGEKTLMIERRMISKIVKENFIIASAISFDPSQKSFLIPITTPIPLQFPKRRIYWSMRCILLCRLPSP